MKAIFISYRRADASNVTGRIFDHLTARFGEDRLFKDVEAIPLGKDFRGIIAEEIGGCRVLLAVIGAKWLDVRDDLGERRIDSREDYVHFEIATALSRGIPVIPLLVDNAQMPKAADLPLALRELAFRNATPVRSDPDFQTDVERLCAQLDDYLKEKPSQRDGFLVKFGTKRVSSLVVVSILFLIIAAWFSWPKSPVPTGSIGIAVAELTEGATTNLPADRTMTQLLLDELRSNVSEAGLNDAVVVVPLQKGIDPSNGSREAINAATEVGATIIIWGWRSKSPTHALVHLHVDVVDDPNASFSDRRFVQRSVGETDRLIREVEQPLGRYALSQLNSFEIHSQISVEGSQMAMFLLGVVQYLANDLSQSERAYQKVVSELPADSDIHHLAYFFLGNVHMAVGRPDEAAASYEKALDGLPVGDYMQEIGAKTINNLTAAKLEVGKVTHEEALQMLNEAIQLSPELGILHANAGINHCNVGDYPKAAASLRRSLDLA